MTVQWQGALARQLDRQATLAFRGEDHGDAGPLPFGRMPAMRRCLAALPLLAMLAGHVPHRAPAPDTS